MIPSFKEYFYPFMLSLSSGEMRKISDIRIFISEFFKLNEEDLTEKTKSGKLRHDDRVTWTASYLKKMKLVSSETKRGYIITSEGSELFKKHGKNFSLDIVRDLEGYHRLQKKEGSANDHWVPGHYTASGRYIPAYVSQWENKGRQKFFKTREEALAYMESKKNKKRKK